MAARIGGEATVYRGREGVRKLWRDLYSASSKSTSSSRRFGTSAIAFSGSAESERVGKESGAETESPFAFLVEAKNGKAIWVGTYLDPKEALEAAGLRE
jgi:hypothetical protein